ncbi:MAG TPA: acyl-CoA carboxylase subunit beta [Solirubrobacteraceae bacterium]|nr:acyl-CoA carboxylase subunit beta [Solirubrobacteraceae bacterium]
MSDLQAAIERARAGGPERHRTKSAERGKLPVRERIALLVDEGSFVEEALIANWEADGLGADGVVTGTGTVAGRPVCGMANDPTVKAGSWGPKTVEKIIRIQERALRLRVPMVYLVDSAGARITDQVQMFPGRRGAGRIFYTEVQMSGLVPQVCVLFGPSAAGGAYIPAFCDVVIMREGNASMYLGSPRMAEMVIGEKVTLDEMGGAKMHTGVSGVGTQLAKTDEEGIALAKRWLSYFPSNWEEAPPVAPPAEPGSEEPIRDIVPLDENKPFDIKKLIDSLVDAESFFEVHPRWAKELVVGFARLDGRVVGLVANQPKQKGGVLFVDSADKAAHFIWLCNAFNVPLLFLADVPGFMIGTAVERQGIIRHGAKMISAVSEATVPKLSVGVRKAYVAGLYAMAGPAFDPDACIALPTASIAVMGPSAAVNAVFYNQLQAIEDPDERARRTTELRDEYAEDIDILHLASELVVDAVIQPEDLRDELIRRFRAADHKSREWPAKRNPVHPV